MSINTLPNNPVILTEVKNNIVLTSVAGTAPVVQTGNYTITATDLALGVVIFGANGNLTYPLGTTLETYVNSLQGVLVQNGLMISLEVITGKNAVATLVANTGTADATNLTLATGVIGSATSVASATLIFYRTGANTYVVY